MSTNVPWFPSEVPVEAEAADETTPSEEIPLTEAEQLSPAYRYSLRLGLPLAASICIHLLLLAILALTTWDVLRGPGGGGDYLASLAPGFSGNEGDSLQWAAQPSDNPNPSGTSVAEPTLDLEKLPQMDLSLGAARTEPAAGSETGTGLGNSLGGLGNGRSSLLGRGFGGSGGSIGASGLSGGGSGRGLGTAGMWGKTVTANRIAFVVDFSGSIIVAVDDLRRELKRSIGSLSGAQSFNAIIFYSDDDKFKTETFASGLQPATPENRQEFFNWIDKKSPTGRTDPLTAIKRALRMQPDAIFFLTDGDFENRVVAEIREANRDNVKICCLVFDELLLQNQGPTQPMLNANARRLKQIADDSGGWMVIVTARDLQRAR